MAEIKNIQIDVRYKSIDMGKIDLAEIKSVIYNFSIEKKIGEAGEQNGLFL